MQSVALLQKASWSFKSSAKVHPPVISCSTWFASNILPNFETRPDAKPRCTYEVSSTYRRCEYFSGSCKNRYKQFYAQLLVLLCWYLDPCYPFSRHFIPQAGAACKVDSSRVSATQVAPLKGPRDKENGILGIEVSCKIPVHRCFSKALNPLIM